MSTAPVKDDAVARQQAAQTMAERSRVSARHHVKVNVHEDIGKDGQVLFLGDRFQPPQEVLPIRVVADDRAPLHPARHSTRGNHACTSLTT
jgi:hypothetical protein